MSKKPSKTTLTRKLDVICSKIIRSRGWCIFCGKGQETLQCAHIYSRTYRNTRWDLENLLCLCAGCHFEAHKNPIIFAVKVKEILGDKLEELNKRHQEIKKFTLFEMVALYEELTAHEAQMSRV